MVPQGVFYESWFLEPFRMSVADNFGHSRYHHNCQRKMSRRWQHHQYRGLVFDARMFDSASAALPSLFSCTA